MGEQVNFANGQSIYTLRILLKVAQAEKDREVGLITLTCYRSRLLMNPLSLLILTLISI
jgi:hypothetical protein